MRKKRDGEPQKESSNGGWTSIEVDAREEPRAGSVAPPPPPHDPNDRVVIGRVGEWEVRRFATDGKLFQYSAPRGMLHLQLWHPGRRISVLTPSPITGGRFEVFPVSGWKKSCRSWTAVHQAVLFEHHLPVPVSSRVVALERWFVAGPERSAVRAHAAASVSAR